MFRNLLQTSLCSKAGQVQLLQARAFMRRKLGISSLLKHLTIYRSNPNKINDTKQPTLFQATTDEEDSSNCALVAGRFDPEKIRDAFAEW